MTEPTIVIPNTKQSSRTPKKSYFKDIFSFIPGAGQMYQEYMKRGLSIISVFAILLILACMASSAIFVVPLLVIEAYSFFDTYNLRNMNDEKRKNYVDDYIWNHSEFSAISNKAKSGNMKKGIGYLLIIVGIYIFFNSVLLRLVWKLDIEWLSEIFNFLSRYIPTITASFIAVFVGIKLVISNQKEE